MHWVKRDKKDPPGFNKNVSPYIIEALKHMWLLFVRTQKNPTDYTRAVEAKAITGATSENPSHPLNQTCNWISDAKTAGHRLIQIAGSTSIQEINLTEEDTELENERDDI